MLGRPPGSAECRTGLLPGADHWSISSGALGWLVAAIFGYALLLLVESFGLWSGRRWGEYFSVVATSVFLPWEIFALTEKLTPVRVILLLINLAAVAWLVWSKRLFGVRGGGRVYRRVHSAESLLAVEQSAVVATASSEQDPTHTDMGA